MPTIRAWLIFGILPLSLWGQETPPPGVLLLHAPPHAVLNDRPFVIDFIVEFGDQRFHAPPPDTVSTPSDTGLVEAPDSLIAETIPDSTPVAIEVMPEVHISAVTLFFRTDKDLTYHELSMPGGHNRYKVNLSKGEMDGDTLTYFFTVSTDEYRLWGYPTDAGGNLDPFVLEMVPPSREYFQRAFRGRR